MSINVISGENLCGWFELGVFKCLEKGTFCERQGKGKILRDAGGIQGGEGS